MREKEATKQHLGTAEKLMGEGKTTGIEYKQKWVES
jgi:hypothetical protein